MFAPFLVVKPAFIGPGFFLWLTGPALAAYITPNLMEQVHRLSLAVPCSLVPNVHVHTCGCVYTQPYPPFRVCVCVCVRVCVCDRCTATYTQLCTCAAVSCCLMVCIGASAPSLLHTLFAHKCKCVHHRLKIVPANVLTVCETYALVLCTGKHLVLLQHFADRHHALRNQKCHARPRKR